jgi:hypothetical protein
VVRQERDTLLRLLPLGDVLDDGDEILRVTLHIANDKAPRALNTLAEIKRLTRSNCRVVAGKFQ